MASIHSHRLSSLLAAAALAMPGAAFAQATTAPTHAPEIVADTTPREEITVYSVGSITDRDGAKPAANPRDAQLPALPVVYEDEPAAPAPVAPAA